MDFETFKQEARKLDIKRLLKETSEYDGLGVLPQIYAVKGHYLMGCYTPKNGGKMFSKPMKGWSKTRRQFEEIAI